MLLKVYCNRFGVATIHQKGKNQSCLSDERESTTILDLIPKESMGLYIEKQGNLCYWPIVNAIKHMNKKENEYKSKNKMKGTLHILKQAIDP